MAGTNIVNKALNWLSRLFDTIASPIRGLDVSDVQIKYDGNEFSELYTFKSEDKDIHTGKALQNLNGEPIELNVLIQTSGAKNLLNPLLSGINRLWDDDFPEDDKNALLVILLGKDNDPGLLQTKFDGSNAIAYTTPAYANSDKWSWGGIADRLAYALECNSPGKDPGMITNQNLSDCGKLIGDYLRLVGLVQSVDEVSVDANGTLVYPILGKMQEFLVDYYNKAVNRAEQVGDMETVEQPTDTQDNTTEDSTANSQGGTSVKNSKHIDVTLQKITGTTSFNMTMIKANYDPSLVLSDMEEIIGQPEFIESLPEELTTYSIEVDDDGFDIEPCEECIECNPCESLCEVFKSGIRAYRNLYILHWMSAGNDMMKLHLMTEEMYGELQSEIDTIGELLVEKQGTVPQLDFPCDYIPVQKYDFQTGLDQIKSLISMYIDCIDYAYCNQTSDVQSTLDEWLRYWNKQLNYFVKGQEI